ncbi:MAG: hypothetical protein H7177_16880 [Rhizobacter sp.]|nr:hypothetical protein [Bacteriovorax sp.]
MNKFLAALAVLTLPTLSFAAASQYGRIVDVKGSGFISYEGATHEMKKGDIINNGSELIIEHSGQVTFTDNADHRFHLGNSSTVAVDKGIVELRSGDVWVQSINATDEAELTSANSKVTYKGGEAILSYDSVKGKTQLMVINGLMKFSNLRAPELNLTVAEGNFTFVDQKFEEGMPRDPTPVGQKTYGQLVAMFKGVAPMDAHSAEIFKDHGEKEKGARGIASVPEKAEKAEKAEKVSELEEKLKQPAHMAEVEKHEAAPAEKAVVKVAHKKTTPVANKLVVKIYGLVGSETSATTDIYDTTALVKTESTKGTRAPASVPETATQTVLDQPVPKDGELKTNPITTPQYKESDKLIDQLNKL